MVVVSHSQNNNNQFLSVVTVLVLPTDEIERPGSIKTELRITVVQLLDGVRFVAIFVIRFVVHHQHRVRPFLIIENYTEQTNKNTHNINQPKVPISQNEKKKKN